MRQHLSALACLVAAADCTPLAKPTDNAAPNHGVAPAPGDAPPPTAAPPSLDDGALPPLPAELEDDLAEVYEMVKKQRGIPIPRLEPAPATPAEHRAWTDGVLEPWLAARRDVGIKLNETLPVVPASSVSEAEWTGYARRKLVHSSLAVAYSVDESIAYVSIPVPESAMRDEKIASEVRSAKMFAARDARDDHEFFSRACEYAQGAEPTPPDLLPFSTFCKALTKELLKHICAQEAIFGTAGEGCEENK